MIILGVDPSLSNTGYGILESVESKLKPIGRRVIKTRSSDPLSLRLSIISQEFDKIIEKFLLDHIAVEDLHSRPKFAKTSILMGHARGVILSSAGIKKFKFLTINLQAKNIVTGSGRADKKQVMLSVSKILNNQNLLKNEHVADAFSIAICHSIINNSKTKFI